MDNIKTKEMTDEGTMNLLVAWRRYNSAVAGVFTLLIISVFPLVFHDYYYDILVAKYIFYYGSVILMIVAMLAGAFFSYIRTDMSLEGVL